eukprot:TRINITY_DN540_c0_g1_i1.p1 TRINITY_DN540_c0_g1~~TRINITY_DN540_c0_g1_i1.p1  ORF type:complete len:188 (+),score=31.27 TRINITY_DN540_c0_g1_i1:2-565(+)
MDTVYSSAGVLISAVDRHANFLTNILLVDPHMFAVIGLSLCIGMSVVGSAWGIWTIGSATLGVSIAKGKLETRNLVSILFCEALSIYGIIVAIIITGKVATAVHDPPAAIDYQAGYQMLSAGLIVGAANFLAGTTLGVIGKGIAESTTAIPNLFVKLLIVLIFGEVLGLYGMITALIGVGSAEFGKN